MLLVKPKTSLLSTISFSMKSCDIGILKVMEPSVNIITSVF